MPSAHTRIALSATQLITALSKTDGWKLHGDGEDVAIEKTYRFSDFLKTMAFVNAVAFVAERQNHHPDMLVGYNTCSVRFHTHEVRGISISDFDCAAFVDALVSTTVDSASHTA